MSLRRKISYVRKVGWAATWRGLQSSARSPVHLILALADHFEPAIDPVDGYQRVPRSEQERRVEWWCREYPRATERWRDAEDRPFVHTYFYPAEQYDEGLLAALADHCHRGWGEIEVHLHHGVFQPDTAENTRRLLTEFRDRMAYRHRCLAVEEGSSQVRYAFVHGNWALANSAGGWLCGVDSEMQILADTGCYADMTMPASLLHPAQIAKLNSVYECALPLEETAPHRQGHDLTVGCAPKTFPLIIQGPLVVDVSGALRGRKRAIESGEISGTKPLTLHRLTLWKRAKICVDGRPDWLFIKLHCHGMNPTQKDAVLGDAFRKFLEDLVSGSGQRKESLHFVTAREMTNILLAACDGREGNPGDYRDYRFKRFAAVSPTSENSCAAPASQKG
jgi:hypothetical protein